MNYIKEVAKLNSPKFNVPSDPDIVHGIIGIGTESGELLDQLKKSIFYGRELDLVNLKEELGDLLWYVALLCHALNCTFEELQTKNIEKLHARYKEKKFSETECENRNLENERGVLEKNHE